MAEQTLTLIKEAEARARDIINNAKSEAAAMIAKASEDAEAAGALFIKKCNGEAADKIENAKKSAFETSAAYLSESESLCVDLENNLLRNKQKALDAVINHILNVVGR